MKIIYYILVTIFGFFGILGALRTIEVLLFSHTITKSIVPTVIFLFIAYICLKKARAQNKLQKMMQKYTQKRDEANDLPVMEFHRKNLLMCLNQFRQLSSGFSTPNLSLLSHETFLTIEAATRVAKSDWKKEREQGFSDDDSFPKYFKAFDKLADGIEPLDTSAATCIKALELTPH